MIPPTIKLSGFVIKAAPRWPVNNSCSALVIPHEGHANPVRLLIGHPKVLKKVSDLKTHIFNTNQAKKPVNDSPDSKSTACK